MKKYLILILSFCCLAFVFTGCNNNGKLLSYVSELRSDLYFGQSEHFSIKAGYGFKEQPFVNDGKVGNTAHLLSFRLLDKEIDDATYSLTLTFNQTEYKGVFQLNPITHAVTCAIELNDFNLKEFTVKVSSGTLSENVLLKSIIPENAISYSKALDFLEKNQNTIISHFTDKEGNFNAEIYLRVLVKDNVPYWYVGLASGNDRLKALLIDGFSGEVLAIREIF